MVVVTGGTRGIGRAVVERFAQEGRTIITCSRSKQDLKHLKTNLEKQFDTQIHVCEADFEKPEDIQHFISFIKGKQQSIDVLVNNVGIFIPASLSEHQEPLFSKLMQVNFYSALHLTQALLPMFRQEHKAHIFNICSADETSRGIYTLTKSALLSMSKTLNHELSDTNIKVTALKLGATLTSSWDGVEVDKSGFILPKDVANLIYDVFNISGTAFVDEITVVAKS